MERTPQSLDFNPGLDSDPGNIAGGARVLGALFLAVAIAFGAFVRIHTALTDPNFDAVHAEGMLKSDPGLLYYFVERILDSGGLPPADWRADPRIEHPGSTDIPALFPVGAEFVIAWCYRAFGGELPLHTFCVWLMGIFASLSAIGVYGIALELTGRVRWAVLTTALFCCLPATYRTIGFILVGEDASMPWFFLHVYLALRAARVQSLVAYALAALALGIALSTWHAASFVFALEMAAVFALFLWTGVNPYAGRSSWITLPILVLFLAAVPVLRPALSGLSPVQPLAAMVIAGWWNEHHKPQRKIACAALAALCIASIAWAEWSGTSVTGYSHVFGLMGQKLLHLGVLPDDPRDLPFDVRLMWQGPFQTLDLAWGLTQLGLAAIAIVFALRTLLDLARNKVLGSRHDLLCVFACVSLPAAYLVERTLFLPGALLPPILALGLQRWLGDRRGFVALACVTAVQAVLFASFVRRYEISWYRPPQRQVEIAALVRRIPECVPEGEAIAADFMNSTAILAHTRHPIVLQPKYEAEASRARAEDFLITFFERTPAEFRALLVNKYQCRYVLVDRFTLWYLSRYAAGIPPSQREPRAGTAAAAFLSQDEGELTSVEGFKLLYRSPKDIVQRDGSPTDFFRLYELAP